MVCAFLSQKPKLNRVLKRLLQRNYLAINESQLKFMSLIQGKLNFCVVHLRKAEKIIRDKPIQGIPHLHKSRLNDNLFNEANFFIQIQDTYNYHNLKSFEIQSIYQVYIQAFLASIKRLEIMRILIIRDNKSFISRSILNG